MPASRFQREISRKESDKERLAARVVRKPALLPELLDGLGSEEARVRYGCAKVLRLIGDREPALLYPRIGFFAKLLDSENRIMQWEAIHVIANLARVDGRNRIEKLLDRYLAPIPGPDLITAANVIDGAARIAVARPKLTERITQALLGVKKARYKTPECRRIALGKVVTAFDAFFDQVEKRDAVIKFVKTQLRSTRAATRKKAERFLNKHAPGKRGETR